MSLVRRLERIEAKLRARNSVADPWLVYDLHEWSKGTRGAFEQEELDNDHDRLVAVALDRLLTAGKITEIDRERVKFIVRTIVHPPKRDDEQGGGSGRVDPGRQGETTIG